ncbi:MAG: hypothetical protein ACQESF_03055 [Nanobdellota archaeon]
MKKKSGQIANEFMILITIVAFFSIIFLGVLHNYSSEISKDKEEKTFSDFGVYLQNEIILASEVKNGYKRFIDIPDKINSLEYTITNTKKSFKITSSKSDMEFFYHIPKIKGDINKGNNKIIKQKGVVYIK